MVAASMRYRRGPCLLPSQEGPVAAALTAQWWGARLTPCLAFYQHTSFASYIRNAESPRKLENLKELRDLVKSLGRGGGEGPLRRAPEEVGGRKGLRVLAPASACMWPSLLRSHRRDYP